MKSFSTNLHKWLLIFLGSLSWSLTMIKSGWIYEYGMGFWGANGHDGVWHIALINSLSRLSLQNPVFSGFNLQNYHIGFDLLLALINKITHIPVALLYFQLFPPVFAILIGYLTYEFVYVWTKSKVSSLWSTFFVYFSGSFSYLIGKGESAFWSQQSISTLINPPYALSLVVILLGLIALLKGKKVLAMLLFGILIEVKVYAAILILGGLLVSKNYKVFFGSLLISTLFYFGLGNFSGSLIVFKPFWFLETMMGLSDHVGWMKFGEAMLNYRSGHVWLKEILTYGIAFAIFIIGNFGTRLFFLKDLFKKFDSIKMLMLSVILAGILIPTIFVQSGTPWNTIQFIYYSLFFSGILTGVAIGDFIKNSKINTTLIRIIVVTVVLLTIPTTMFTLKDVYIPSRPPAKVSNNELSALDFLSKQPNGVVLTYPFDLDKAKEAESTPPRPLYLYTSTAYVSAFSKQTTFLEDEINLDITGYDWAARKGEVLAWYQERDEKKARDFLKKNNITYIYWLKGQRAVLSEGQLGLKNIFENSKVTIYNVKK